MLLPLAINWDTPEVSAEGPNPYAQMPPTPVRAALTRMHGGLVRAALSRMHRGRVRAALSRMHGGPGRTALICMHRSPVRAAKLQGT